MKDGPLWSRVSRRMWRSTDFRAMGPMPPCAATLWLYLLTGEHRTKVPGLFVLGAGTMSDDLRWQPTAVRKHLATLVEKGHVKVDADTNLVWIPNSLDHNLPDNPNMVMGWKRDWQAIPSSALKTEARDALRKGLEALPRPEKSTVTYAEAFAVALGERNPPSSGKDAGNGGGKVPPIPPADVPATLGGIEDSEREGEKATTPKPPPERAPVPPAQPPKPEPVVVAAKPVDGDELLSRMASASKFKFDCMASDSIGRTDILRRLAAYGVDGPLADAMGILMRDPAKVWPWATSIGKGPVTIALLVGKGGSDGSKTGAMLASLVAAARDSLAAEAKRNARPVAPTAPARPLRPENIPGTPEYIAANERTRAAAQARIKALSASEESATAPASAVVQ